MSQAAHGLSPLRIKLVFLVHALASGSMFPRIPDLQQQLGIDAGVLGLAFIGQPVGAIAMFLVSSRIVERLGTRTVLMAGIPLMAAGLVLMALAPSPAALFAAIAGFAAVFALTNVAMNVEADRIEAATGRRVMNMCHGVWSLGQLTVFALGVLARGLDVSPLVHFGALLPVVAVATLAVLVPMQAAPVRIHTGTVRRGLALPSPATIRLLGFMVGSGLVEAAARTWSVIYARDSFDSPPWADALTLPVFVGGIALGRFLADGWTARYGPAAIARVLFAVALGGVAVIVAAPSLPVALAGFALAGFGICTGFPASTSAAAQIGDRPASENVAALTLSTSVVMLGAPPLMGLVADALGIRATFALTIPMLVVAIALASALEPRRR